MSTCGSGNEYDGRLGVRISAIFVILVGSFLGTWFPVFAARHKGVGIPGWAFFVAKVRSTSYSDSLTGRSANKGIVLRLRRYRGDGLHTSPSSC
jgi:hypothetical protein